MGAGKTTIGRRLAKEMGLMFYDLDWYIQSRMRRTVAEIFQENGEAGFRDIERRMLHEVAEFEDVVISCGGGTPCFYDNMDYLNRQGDTVYLKCSPDVLHAHLRMGKSVRPLLLGKTDDEVKAFVREQLERREPFYSRARHVFDVSLLDTSDKIEVSARKIMELVDKQAS